MRRKNSVYDLRVLFKTILQEMSLITKHIEILLPYSKIPIQ